LHFEQYFNLSLLIGKLEAVQLCWSSVGTKRKLFEKSRSYNTVQSLHTWSGFSQGFR